MSSGGRNSDKGKAIMEESDFPNPQDNWEFEDDEIPIYPDVNVGQEPTQESIHFPSEEIPTTKGREVKSDIWKHFKKTSRPDLGPKMFNVICNYCGSDYKFKQGSGYGSFTKHLKSKHPTEAGIDRSQQQIPRYTNSDTQSLFRFNETKYKEQLGKFVSVEHLAFSFGEKFAFNEFIQSSCAPQAKPISRNTLKRTILGLYNKGKKDLQILFRNFNGRVHIGSDIWSDHWQTHSYMGVICHWIDDNWNIQKRVIAYRVFDDKHTAINIYRLIRQILEEYYLLNKIFSIGFDNAAANTASINDLKNICKPVFGGQFFHIRCVCHVLNLCVQDGLKTLSTCIIPIKMAIQYLWNHSQIMKEWKKFCKANGRRPKTFPKDVPTRWNSTYMMLNESYPYSDLICAFISNNVPQLDLYPHQWVICKKILDVLKIFNDATYTLSGVYYPTTHLFLIECTSIVGVFHENQYDPQLHETIIAMRTKWLQYYKEIPMIYLVAFVFDPRFKLDGLTDILTTYNDCMPDEDKIDVLATEINVKKMIVELYDEFCSTYNISDNRYSQSSNIPSENIGKLSKGAQFLLNRQKKQKGSIRNNAEIENYLTVLYEYDGDSTAFPILEWWKSNSSQYPVLALIARQILATPCSTVAVEQAFSAGGNILDERRSRLSPDSLEAQTCVDDWTKAEYRQQEIDRNSEAEFFDDGDTTGTGTETDD